MQILIAGCGDVGTRLGMEHLKRGDEVWALRRQTGSCPIDFRMIAADLTRRRDLDALPMGFDIVYYTAAAGSGEAEYRATFVDGQSNLIDALGSTSLLRYVFVSSTAVYGQSSGEWVDETSPTAPIRYNGKILIEAEAIARRAGWPVTIARAGGIYGPGRTRLIDRIERGIGVRDESPPKYTNRIHVDDLAEALVFLAEARRADEIYNLVDSDPAPRAEVHRWLAGKLGVELSSPVEDDGEAVRGSKRCSNARLLGCGYALRHPTYRAGYAGLL